MKTYEDFRCEVLEWDFQRPVSHLKIEELAAKEYAKQWVEYSYKKQFRTIEDIKNEIDTQ